MRSYLLILCFGSYLVCGQVESSLTSLLTADTISASPNVSLSASLITTKTILTPSSLLTDGASTTSFITSDEANPTTSTVLSEESSSTTEAASSTASIVEDDEAEITATGIIAAEDTAMPDLLGSVFAPRELTAEESVRVTALDLETYADLLVNAPLAGDTQLNEDAVSLPACPVSANDLEKRQLFGSRPKRPRFYPCMPTSIAIEVIYRYVPADQKNATAKADLTRRVRKQHAYFAKAVGEFGISLTGDATLKFLRATPSASDFTNNLFSELDTPEVRARRGRLLSYRKKTRTGSPETLNVWIVDRIEGDDPGRINGYAQFPEDRQFDTDGIVLNIDALRSDNDAVADTAAKSRGVTLIHEFGHWMGLRHTFGDSDCGQDDGIADTWQTSNSKDTRHNDYQEVCNRPDLEAKWIYYYMSYSTVRSTYKDSPTSINLRSFTKGQRAVMFSRFFAFRRGVIYRANFCEANKRRTTREDYHALRRRAEDKAKVLADLLLTNCSIAIQDVFEEESIPLPSSALASYSSVALSMIANPTSNTNMFAPKTATIGAGTVVAAATGTGTGTTSEAKAEKSSTSSTAVSVKANGQAVAFMSILCLVLVAIFDA